MAVPIIDTFPYNGEAIVEMRLKAVYPHVSEIIITEAMETHSGTRKPELYFHKNKALFEPFMDKITFVCIDAFPEMPVAWKDTRVTHCPFSRGHEKDWWRESQQRDKCMRLLLKKSPDILVVASDVDEIPNMAMIAANAKVLLDFGRPVHLEMAMHYYSWEWKKKYPWRAGFVVSNSCLTDSFGLDHIRVMIPDAQKAFLKNGGWHCSFFMEPADILRKIQGSAHQEHNTPMFADIRHIQRCIESGVDILLRGEHENCIRSSSDDTVLL